MTPTSNSIPAHLLEPSAEEQRVQEGISGHDPDRAHARLVDRDLASLDYIQKIHPTAAQQICADFARVEAGRVTVRTALHQTREALGQLREKLAERGAVRSQIAAAKADLENARTTLDSPASLKMDGASLATMTAKVKHLPGEIAGLEKSVRPLTDEIEKLAKELKLEVPQAVRVFYTDACVRLVGTVQDPQFKSFCDQNLIL